jgi:HPt (histidine-containing phosphotransfer) domain-containing protein
MSSTYDNPFLSSSFVKKYGVTRLVYFEEFPLYADAIRRAVHMIKGTSAILGARPLAEQCAELEHLSRSGVVQDVATRVAAIEASYRKVEAALAKIEV